MIVATALVMLMTPGLAFFYGGLVRSKNVLNTLMMSFMALGHYHRAVGAVWLLGRLRADGVQALRPSSASWRVRSVLGGTARRRLGRHRSANAPTIPGAIFMLFQMTFAIITPALISGAIAERMKFSAYCLFILLWATFFYDPLAHMVWDGGLIGTGGSPCAGLRGRHGRPYFLRHFSALTLAIMIGKRKAVMAATKCGPHNVPMVLLGATLLWFGWFGFNAGSASWPRTAWRRRRLSTRTLQLRRRLFRGSIVEWIRFKKPTAVGFASGAVAGLVAITPACGWVNSTAALIIGLLVSPICYQRPSQMKGKLNIYDDALDVFGVHACGGMWGAIATGLWANSKINPGVTGGIGVSNGIFSGLDGASLGQLWAQLGAIAITVVCAIVSTVIWGNVTKLMCGGLRPTADDEETGLDVTDHGEVGYGSESGGVPAFAGAD